ncbi:MAG: MBL fold metallo-hydrolase [Planctomycetia bacterium]|nr:MBL fold metallo-hydrolase [Planctomycetia bacterium]
MIFCPLISGSTGNATYVAHKTTHILVDCGASARQIEKLLDSIDVSARDLTALLVTHAHRDHINGLGAMSRRYNLPIYASVEAWKEMSHGDKVGRIGQGNIKVFRRDQPCTLDLGDLEAEFFATPHDAAGSVGYLFRDGSKVAGIATDFGIVTDAILRALKTCDVALVESNHDVDMLRNGPYPRALQDRILSMYGHLCNEDAAALAVQLAQNGARAIYLGHLSQHNNTPNLALETTREAMIAMQVAPQSDCRLYVASPVKPCARCEI